MRSAPSAPPSALVAIEPVVVGRARAEALQAGRHRHVAVPVAGVLAAGGEAVRRRRPVLEVPADRGAVRVDRAVQGRRRARDAGGGSGGGRRRAGGEGGGREREQDAEHEEEAHRRPSTRARGGGFGGTLLRIPTSEMNGPYPFERPLGAFPTGDGRAEFRALGAEPGVGDAARRRSRPRARPAPASACSRRRVEAAPGEDYAFVVNGIEFPDPATRWQPHGLRGRSRLLDTTAFAWTDGGFRAPALRDSRSSTSCTSARSPPEGTFDAAIPHLRGLRELGITTIELMPVAAFPGRHGWGYDGVYISAAPRPLRRPARPAAVRRRRARARASRCCSTSSTTTSAPPARRAWSASAPTSPSHYETPWGRAMNYDDADSDAVREWVLQSAEQWIRDFHLDGLRLDAIHAILDSNPEHLVAAIARRVHAANPRAVVIAESGLNDPQGALVGGWGCDARLGRRLPPRAARAADRRPRGLLRGVRHARRAGEDVPPPALPRRHATRRSAAAASARRPTTSPPEAFVVFSSNHDQVGNRALGDRLPVEARPLAAFCTLLAPFTPMLFQGEEYGERRAVPVLLRPHRRGDRGPRRARAAGASSPPSPSSPARRSPTRRTRRPSSAPSSRARASRAGLRELYARAAARPRASCPPATPTPIDFDEHAGWLRVAPRRRTARCANFSQRDVHVPARGDGETVRGHAPRHARAGLRGPAGPQSGALLR